MTDLPVVAHPYFYRNALWHVHAICRVVANPTTGKIHLFHVYM